MCFDDELGSFGAPELGSPRLRDDRAIAQFNGGLAAEPGFTRAHMIVYAYAQKGMFTEALAELWKCREIAKTPWNWGMEAYVQELLRRVGLAN